jgi:hypothetical protein
MSTASGIFNNSNAFEAYLAQLTERLRAERQARLAFLSAAIDKLTPLLELAQSLQNESVIAEVQAHLAAARAEVATLREQAA